VSAQPLFALSRGRPPAGIAVIRVSGPQAHDAGAALAGSLPAPRTAVVRQLRNPDTGELLDEVLLLRFDAPASATGEDVVEFHCHGGRAVVDAIGAVLGDLPDLRVAEPGEFTRRAFANGRMDLTEAEGLADLIEAETQAQRRAALAVAEGGLRRKVEELQDRLLTLSAIAERAIDYDEEDAPLDPALPRECASLAEELEFWLRRPRVEPLQQGIRVVAAGPPNAGKSSLINAIAGEDRAIVTDIPGTTRDAIEVPIAIDGIPFLLTDTAGLRESDDPVESIGIERAERLVRDAEILLWLGEPDERPDHDNAIQLAPKSDLGSPMWPSAHPVSVVTGSGLAELMQILVLRARTLLPADDAIALNRRQAALLAEASRNLRAAVEECDDALLADRLRQARWSFQRLTGRAGDDDVLDNLFSRFCLGK
jgi:tRNA modification GTPase